MTPTKDSAIDYDHLVQDALRGVVRTILTRVSDNGLPGNHHFYIAFRTDHPGVEVPEHLRQRYPEEITIVLQHQFWDLLVGEDMFEVCLSFNKKPERLVVPFEALTGFMDPSVQFGLQLHADSVPAAQDSGMQPSDASTLAPAPESADTAVPNTGATEDAGVPDSDQDDEGVAEEALPTGSDGADNVVPLDQFRKKTTQS
jgi:hypothetical protein